MVVGPSSSLNKISPSIIHPHLKIFCFFASFNFIILSSLKISVIVTFLLLTFFITGNIESAGIKNNYNYYRSKFLLSPSFIKLLALYVWSIYSSFILIIISVIKVSKTKSSVFLSLFFLIPRIKSQLLFEYYSCVSTFNSKFFKCSCRVETSYFRAISLLTL